MYENKPLDEWFYGDRRQFFNQVRLDTAVSVFNALGTNAFPFLLSKLTERHGDGALYFKFYHALPAWLRGRLSYPLSGDDIKANVLLHLTRMRPIPSEQVGRLADSVPGLANPRLRMSAFHLLTRKYQTDPAFLKLCRKLLDDPHPGIQLEAAIYLADSAIASDPQEQRLAPILLAGLEDKKLRDSVADISMYYYQQQPPGAPPSGAAIARPPAPNQDRFLVDRITTALIRLKPYMSQPQKDKLKELSKSVGPSPPDESFIETR